ncbi:hypothetical protein [Streptomyces rhizosphaericola]|uniref:Uncharacterized protein n=1 Tax=Streptomyces rhizosphaericola TaxID=2564098 RepID=A0ABY2P911_9ACTN|nr:hypothetical protein [Streptomyces rhizosphaericola]TGZ03404.1 hypothetical protein E5Z02_26250 [Streptomyces rhizosphaericola]
MSLFDDALFGERPDAAELADEKRAERIGMYLDAHDVRPYTRFFAVVDDALYAEEDAKVRGLYPPVGHGYPREDGR